MEASAQHDWSSLRQIDWRVKKFELVFVGFALVVTGFLATTPLPFSISLLKVFAVKILQFTAVVYGLATLVLCYRYLRHFCAHRRLPQRTPEELLPILMPYFSADFLLRTVRRGIAILGVVFFFLHLKHVVLTIHPANYDLFFWNLDRTIHFGVQPNILLMELFGQNQDAAILIDWLYFAYFKYLMLASVLFMMEVGGKTLADKFFLAYTLLWSAGGLGYLVMPADGPCYAVLGPYSIDAPDQRHIFQLPITKDIPKEYAYTYRDAKIWKAKVFQAELWHHRKAYLFGEKLPGMYYGISAMPSLHVAAVTMIMIFFFAVHPFLGIAGVLFAIVTFIGSVFLQWHYAIDGYVGMLISGLVCQLSLRRG